MSALPVRLFKPLTLALILTGAGAGALFFYQPDLETIHRHIERSHRNVAHIEPEAFSELAPDAVVVFDVREPEEHAVSRIEGAVRVDADITPEEFAARHGSRIKGATAVFYCSVGRRSSRLIERLDGEIAHAEAAYNLTGGVFRWRNEGRPLVTGPAGHERPSEAVHPYNAYWARLIVDRSAVRRRPAM